MSALELHLHQLHIPFRFKYGHAKAQHQSVGSIVGLLKGQNGDMGFSESVPRTYVTGETPESVIADCILLAEHLRSFDSLSEKIGALLAQAKSWTGRFPACAVNVIDLALHSLQAQQQKLPLYASLGQKECRPLDYTISIGFGSKLSLFPKLMAYKAMGFNRYKLKVGKADDLERLNFIRKILGNQASFYADANGAWSLADAPGKIDELNRAGIWAIEEPLNFPTSAQSYGSPIDREATLDDAHYQRYQKLKQQIDIPLIADESLISFRSYQKIIEAAAFDILNIRLSKCGGIALASTMIQQAPSTMAYGVCAMVGETGILATHGSHFAQVHNNYSMLQGHSHRPLHKGRLTIGEPGLERGGRLVLNSSRSGLGLKLNQQLLNNWTIQKQVISL